MARRSFNDEASRVGGEDPAPANPHACAANGCPISASVSLEGAARVCFVHEAIQDRAEWDQATSRIHRQKSLVEVIRALRRSDSVEIVAKCIELCPQLAPGDGTPPTRYAALRRAEAFLVAECTAEQASSVYLASPMPDYGAVRAPLTRDEKRRRSIENIRHIAERPGAMRSQLPALVSMFGKVYGERCPVDVRSARTLAPMQLLREPGEDDE